LSLLDNQAKKQRLLAQQDEVTIRALAYVVILGTFSNEAIAARVPSNSLVFKQKSNSSTRAKRKRSICVMGATFLGVRK
jgi:hypothetical protein